MTEARLAVSILIWIEPTTLSLLFAFDPPSLDFPCAVGPVDLAAASTTATFACIVELTARLPTSGSY